MLKNDIHNEGDRSFSNCFIFICSPTKNKSNITPISDRNFMSVMFSSVNIWLMAGNPSIMPAVIWLTTLGTYSFLSNSDKKVIRIRQISIAST